MTRPFQNIPTRTLVYSALVVILAVVFVVQETTQTHRNTFPVPPFAVESVDQVKISGPDGELVFRKAAPAGDGTTTNAASVWLMDDENYPVADGRIESLLENVAAVKAADIVTARGQDKEYGLDEENRRTLRIFTGDVEPVALQLGGSAAAGNAVYGRVNTSREIVLLPTSLDTAVSTDPMRFRNTTMVAIPKDRIVAARIERAGYPTVTVQPRLDDDTADDTDTETDTTPASDWTATNPESGEQIPGATLDAFIRELASLQATDFPEYMDSPFPSLDGEPAARITVETTGSPNKTPVEISLWPIPAEEGQQESELVAARSSTSPYEFVIPRWRAKRLLLGLEGGT